MFESGYSLEEVVVRRKSRSNSSTLSWVGFRAVSRAGGLPRRCDGPYTHSTLYNSQRLQVGFVLVQRTLLTAQLLQVVRSFSGGEKPGTFGIAAVGFLTVV